MRLFALEADSVRVLDRTGSCQPVARHTGDLWAPDRGARGDMGTIVSPCCAGTVGIPVLLLPPRSII